MNARNGLLKIAQEFGLQCYIILFDINIINMKTLYPIRMKFMFVLSFLLMSLIPSANVEAGDTFTATTIEGIEMTFKVFSESSKTAIVSSGREDVPAISIGTTGTVTIPQEAKGYRITGIGEEAFRETSLSSVNIPVGVLFIGEKAFAECMNLSSVTLPEGVTSIGEEAFSESALSSIVLPTSLVRIGEQAFEGTRLTTITLPRNVAYLGNADRVDEETGRLIVEDDLFADIFNGCSALTEVKVDASNKVYASMNGILMTKDLKTLLYFPQAKADNTIPSGVETIYCDAFADCTFSSITLPASITAIEEDAFDGCYQLMSIISEIMKPSAINHYAFSYSVYEQATLYVPLGTKDLYEATEGWNNFQNIVEMESVEIEPLEDGEEVDFGENSELTEGTDLGGVIADNMYFNIPNDKGRYEPVEGCIVITSSTSDEDMAAIEGKEFFDKDLMDHFAGFIFKVPAGQGNIRITAETTGDMTLRVKIGDDDPIEKQLDGRRKVSIPYNVSVETLVYVYAGQNASVKGVGPVTASSGELKIYSIEREDLPTDIANMDSGTSDVTIYSLSGQRLTKPQKGVNIVGGKKVLMR